MVRYHIIVHGHVQGVGFRFYSYQNAIKNNVRGWVRNNYDGTVEIDAVGCEEDMVRFIDLIKTGPAFSNVEHLNIQEIKDLKEYKSFEIKY